MPLPVPNLDDRNYAQLVAEAKALIPSHCPEWTDISPGDIGTTLIACALAAWASPPHANRRGGD
jgi:hypothetical protein